MAALLCLFWRVNRNAHHEAGVAGHRVHRNLAMHAGHDTIDEIETKARAVTDAFGGEKRLKNTRLDLGRDTRAIVCNLYEDALVFARRSDAQFTVVAHGVSRVVAQ